MVLQFSFKQQSSMAGKEMPHVTDLASFFKSKSVCFTSCLYARNFNFDFKTTYMYHLAIFVGFIMRYCTDLRLNNFLQIMALVQ